VTNRRHDKVGRRQPGSLMVSLPGEAIAAGRAAAQGQAMAEPGCLAWRKTASDNAAVTVLNRMLDLAGPGSCAPPEDPEDITSFYPPASLNQTSPVWPAGCERLDFQRGDGLLLREPE
jgi:hypothetical protein